MFLVVFVSYKNITHLDNDIKYNWNKTGTK